MYEPSPSHAGIEIVNFVKSLKEQFWHQFDVKRPYTRFDLLPGEVYGRMLLLTPLAADRASAMSPVEFGYLSDNAGSVMAFTEADQIIFQVLLTYGFQKPDRDLETQWEEAEYFALQKAMDIDHGIGEIRMRLERQYPFMRSFSVLDRVEHVIEDHKDDRALFVIDLMCQVAVRLMIRKTQDGRHLPFDQWMSS